MPLEAARETGQDSRAAGGVFESDLQLIGLASLIYMTYTFRALLYGSESWFLSKITNVTWLNFRTKFDDEFMELLMMEEFGV